MYLPFINALGKLCLVLSVILISCLGLSSQYSIVYNGPTGDNLENHNVNVCQNSDGDKAQVRLVITSDDAAIAQVAVAFPTGVQYIPGSLSLVDQMGGLNIAEFNISNLSNPIFAVTASNLTIGNEITFQYSRVASCDAIDFQAQGGVFKDLITVDDGNVTIVEDDEFLASYDILTPALSMFNNGAITGTVGSDVESEIRIVNGGLGFLSELNFVINDNIGTKTNSLQTSTGTTVTPSPSGNIINYTLSASVFSNFGNRDNYFDSGEEIILKRSYEILACVSPSNYQASWGCGSASCYTTPELHQQTNVKNSLPNLKMTMPVVDQDVCMDGSDAYQGGSAIHQRVKVENTGTGAATNFTLTMHNWTPGSGRGQNYFSNEAWRVVDEGGAVLGTMTLGATVQASFYQSNCSTAYHNTEVTQTASNFEIAAGQTVYIEIPTYYNNIICPSCPRGLSWIYYNASFSYEDDCQNNSYYTPRFTLFARGHNFQRYDVEIPTDVYDGECFDIFLNYNRVYAHIGNGNASGGYTNLVVDLSDTGLSYTGGSTIAWRGYTLPVIASANELRIRLPDNAISGGPIRIPMCISCTGIMSGVKTIDFYHELQFNGNCTSGPRTQECLTKNFVLHCGGPCAEGGATPSSFKMERTTLGLEDLDDNGVPDNGSTAKPSDVKLNRGVNGDNVTATWEIRVSENTVGANAGLPFNHIYVEFDTKKVSEYCAAQTARTSLFTALPDADISVRPARGTPFTCQVSPTIKADGYAMYDLSSCKTDWEAGDEITVEAYFVANGYTSSTSYVPYISNNKVYASYVATPSATDQYTCDFFNDYFNIYNIWHSPYMPHPQKINGCENIIRTYLRNYINIQSSAVWFPNEYRNFGIYDEFIVEWPSSQSYKSGSATFSGLPISDSDVTQTATQLIFRNLKKFYTPHGGTIMPRDEVDSKLLSWSVEPTCEAESIFKASFSALSLGNGVNTPSNNWESHVYCSRKQSGNADMIYETAKLLLAGGGVSQPAATNACWEFVLNNVSNAFDANYSWLYLNDLTGNMSNFTMTQNGSTISKDGNGFYRLDVLTPESSSNFTVCADFTTCNPFELEVQTGFSCKEYPSGQSAASCQESLILEGQPQNAEIQGLLETAPADPTDICGDQTVVYSINSAQTAYLNDPKIVFELPDGISIIGPVEIEYPSGSGNWEIITVGILGNVHTVYAEDHSSLDFKGLPGTAVAISKEEREINIRFTVNNSGLANGISLSAFGGNPCGGDAINNGFTLNTDDLDPLVEDEVTNELVCAGTAVNWEGSSYTTADTYEVIKENALGCSYKSILILTNHEATPEELQEEEVCPGTIVNWEGGTYTDEDTYTIVKIDENGCEYNAVLELTHKAKPADIVTTDNSCPGVDYTWTVDGNNYNTTGIYRFISPGCDADQVLDLTIYPATTPELTQKSICEGGSFDWEGSSYTVEDIYVITKKDANGCDYEATLELIVDNAPADNIIPLSICAGTSYVWPLDGNTYDQEGMYTIAGVSDCDADQILDLSFYPVTPDELTEKTICKGEVFAWEGADYNTTDTYVITKKDANDCAYDVVLELTVVDKAADIVTNETICEGGSYTWSVDGLDYNMAGTYTVPGASSCDADQVLILAETANPDDIITNEFICFGTSYDWAVDGLTYTETGSVTVEGATECDADQILNLTVYADPNISTTANICPGGTYDWEGNTYDQAGTYTVDLVDANGCDYQSELVLTSTDTPADVVTNKSICEGQTFDWFFNTYDAEGQYTYPGQTSCDATQILNLTIFEATPDESTSETICEGTSFDWEGNSYTEANIYNVIKQDDNGCEYRARLVLAVVADEADIVTNASICPGTSYTWAVDGNSYDVADTYTIPGELECNAAQVLILNIHPTTPDELTQETVCFGQSFDWEGNSYDVEDTYTIVKLDANGCEYEATLELTIDSEIADIVTTENICAGTTFDWTVDGNSYDVTGMYTVDGATECDADQVLDLTVYPETPRESITINICPGDSYDWEGASYTDADTYINTYQDANGCDYESELILTVSTAAQEVITPVMICSGTNYNWAIDGLDYNTEGSFTVPGATSCDADQTLQLSFYPVTADELTQETVCFGQSFDWEGSSYDVTDTYTIVKLDANGCEYNAVLELTVSAEPTAIVTTENICAGTTFDWTVDGNSYDATGMYTIDGVTECDADQVLDLTVYPETPRESITINICPGDSYDWEGASYTDADTYINTYQDANGCDYESELILTVSTAATEVVTPVTICSGTVYTWAIDGLDYNTEGSFTIPGATACDADQTLEVSFYAVTVDELTQETVCFGQSFDWEGNTYDATDTYTIVKLDANGCEYNAVLELTVGDEPTPIVTKESICAGTTYDWTVDGNAYNATGSYTVEGATACDADQVLELEVFTATPNESIEINICPGDSYDWEGATYTDANTYTNTYQDANGCDYTSELVLIVSTDPVPVESSVTICNGDVYNWTIDGQDYSTEGSFTVAGATSCDADQTLNLSFFAITPDEFQRETICEGESFDWEGSSYSTSDIYVIVKTDANGCEFNATLELTIQTLPEPIITQESVCAGNSITWDADGNEYSFAGTYIVEGTDCTANQVLQLEVFPATPREVIEINICPGESYDWEGNNYTTQGTYIEMVQDANGCDYESVLNLIVSNDPQPVTTAVTICEGDVYNWSIDDQDYNAAGSFTVPGTTGCDSDQTLILSFFELTQDELTQETICEGETFDWEGNSYTNQDTYVVVKQDDNGCEYDAILELTVTAAAPPVISSQTICAGEDFVWDADGNTYTDEGTFVIDGATECDANQVLQLAFYTPTQNESIEINICPGESYDWQGTTYTAADTYVNVLQDANGCDYESQLVLVVSNDPAPVMTSITICEGDVYNWAIDGQDYNAAGTFTVAGTTGCEADQTLELSFHSATANELTQETICAGESIDWEGTTYDVADTYTIIKLDANGCEYEATLELIVGGDVPAIVNTASICAGESYAWDVDGNSYDAAGSYTVEGVTGCDADQVLNLEVYPATQNESIEINICPGESYDWQGTTYTTADTYVNVLQDANGCDYESQLVLNVSNNPQDVLTQITICEGDSYEWQIDNQMYDVEGTFTVAGTTACEATQILELNFFTATSPTIETANICEGESYDWEGVMYTVADTYVIIKQDANGCDYEASLNLIIDTAPAPMVTNTTICEGDAFIWDVDGQSYDAVGNYTVEGITGCDADQVLELAFYTGTADEMLEVNICPGESYDWEGVTYTDADTYIVIKQDANGCEYESHLILNVSNNPQDVVSQVSICFGESYDWQIDNQTYDQAGTYTVAGMTACEATQILELVIFDKTQDEEEMVNICPGESYDWQGTIYTDADTYVIVKQDANGCDYNSTLILTVSDKAEDVLTQVSICSGESYDWNVDGNTYDTAGSFTVEANNACDANQVLELIVYPGTEDQLTDVEICDGEVYNWNGQDYNAEGSYSNDLADANGCEYKEILNLRFKADNECDCDAIADAGNGQNISCDIEFVTLGGSMTSTGAGFEAYWIDDNQTVLGQESTLTVDQAGNYTLVVTDVLTGCTSQSSVVVEDISTNPEASIQFDLDTIINCYHDKVLMNIENEQLDLDYHWIFNGVEFNTPSLAVEEQGEVILVVLDPVSGCIGSDTFNVQEMRETPEFEMSVPEELTCKLTEVSLGITDVDSPDFIYNWYNSSNDLLGDGNTMMVTAEGTYFLEVRNISNGCTSRESVEVKSRYDYPEVAMEEKAEMQCNETTALIGISEDMNPDYDYQWLDKAGQAVSAVNQDEMLAEGLGYYYMQVTNKESGCITMDSIQVVLSDRPAEFDLNVNNPKCIGDENGNIRLIGISGGTAPYQVELNNEEIKMGRLENDLSPGTYAFTVKDDKGCELDTMIILEEGRDVELDLVDDLLEVDCTEEGEIELITNIPSGDIQSIWYSGDLPVSCDTCLMPIVAPRGSAKHQIKITDVNGCFEVTDLEIIVDKTANVYVPNAINLNSNDYRNTEFQVFCDDKIEEIVYLGIFSRWGELLFEQKEFQPNEIIPWDGILDEEEVATGVYTVRIDYRTICGDEVEEFSTITVLK